MPWNLYMIADTENGYMTAPKKIFVNQYDTQALARWWAVAFCERGSVSINQNQPNEICVPMTKIRYFKFEEV